MEGRNFTDDLEEKKPLIEAFPHNAVPAEDKIEAIKPSDWPSWALTDRMIQFRLLIRKIRMVGVISWSPLIVSLILSNLSSKSNVLLGYLSVFIPFVLGLLLYVMTLVSLSPKETFPRILDTGSLIMWFVLTIVQSINYPVNVQFVVRWSSAIVGSCFFVIVIVGIALGKPFTLEYARPHIPEHVWTIPQARAAIYSFNNLLASIWAFYFAIMAGFGIASAILFPAITDNDWRKYLFTYGPLAVLLIVFGIQGHLITKFKDKAKKGRSNNAASNVTYNSIIPNE
jgi:hypothetical protein